MNRSSRRLGVVMVALSVAVTSLWGATPLARAALPTALWYRSTVDPYGFFEVEGLSVHFHEHVTGSELGLRRGAVGVDLEDPHTAFLFELEARGELRRELLVAGPEPGAGARALDRRLVGRARDRPGEPTREEDLGATQLGEAIRA